MKSACVTQLYKMPNSWEFIPWGKYYCIALNQKLQPWWPQIFGFHLLKIGKLSLQINTQSSFISHQFSMNIDGSDFQLLGSSNEMPFDTKSIDACLLIHQLSYSANPHWLLRETDRILVDDGWLILSNFNPFSLLGIGKSIPFLNKLQPYRSHMFSICRQLDWLSLLNYEILYQQSFQLLPWISPDHFINKNLKFLGCINLIIARKRKLPLNPIPIKFMRTRVKIGNILGVVKFFCTNLISFVPYSIGYPLLLVN
ncbi:MAG: methyltransferase domain-containing protein [Arsenophonus sp.]